MPAVLGSVKRWLFIIAGTIFVGLGVVGMVVPLLPTTPFLLLAAFCYVRSSPRLHSALLNNRWVGSYIRNYLEGKGIPLKTKILALALLWAAIILSAVFATDRLIVRTLLVVIAIAVTIHICRVKTIKQN